MSEITTEAGREMRGLVSSIDARLWDRLTDLIAAVETESYGDGVAAERARLAEAVRGLRGYHVTASEAGGEEWAAGYQACRAAVLALLEPTDER